MDRDAERVAELRAQGNCCAQVQVRMALEMRGEENEQLVQSAGGLCGGVRTGLVCGALSGAAMALSMFDFALAKKEMIPALTKQFAQKWGTTECAEILSGNENKKNDICLRVMQETWKQAKQILKEHGFEQQ